MLVYIVSTNSLTLFVSVFPESSLLSSQAYVIAYSPIFQIASKEIPTARNISIKQIPQRVKGIFETNLAYMNEQLTPNPQITPHPMKIERRIMSRMNIPMYAFPMYSNFTKVFSLASAANQMRIPIRT